MVSFKFCNLEKINLFIFMFFLYFCSESLNQNREQTEKRIFPGNCNKLAENYPGVGLGPKTLLNL